MTTSAKRTIRDTQTRLKALGFDPKGLDGLWGRNSESAFQAMYDTMKQTHTAWGLRFTEPQLDKLKAVMARVGFSSKVDASDLMSCMAFETGTQFTADTRNRTSGATGLIQFMPSTARGLNTTTDALAKMSIEEQLDFVGEYFKSYAKRIGNLGDMYMAILWPRGIGKDDSYPLWQKGTIAYTQNAGLDLNGDGTVTRSECLHKIKNMMVRGFDASVARKK